MRDEWIEVMLLLVVMQQIKKTLRETVSEPEELEQEETFGLDVVN